MKSVYSHLMVTSLCAAVSSYFSASFQVGPLLYVFGSLACMLGVKMIANTPENLTTRFACMCGYGFFSGIMLNPVINMAARVDPTIPMTALMGTCAIFACFSLSAMFAVKSKKYMMIGGFLSSAMSSLMVLSFVSIFVRSEFLFMARLYMGLLVFSLYIIYDTQVILLNFKRGHNDPISSSIDLFVDLVAVFVRLLIILSKNK
eukprot:Pgem_evm1s6085